MDMEFQFEEEDGTKRTAVVGYNKSKRCLVVAFPNCARASGVELVTDVGKVDVTSLGIGDSGRLTAGASTVTWGTVGPDLVAIGFPVDCAGFICDQKHYFRTVTDYSSPIRGKPAPTERLNAAWALSEALKRMGNGLVLKASHAIAQKCTQSQPPAKAKANKGKRSRAEAEAPAKPAGLTLPQLRDVLMDFHNGSGNRMAVQRYDALHGIEQLYVVIHYNDGNVWQGKFGYADYVKFAQTTIAAIAAPEMSPFGRVKYGFDIGESYAGLRSRVDVYATDATAKPDGEDETAAEVGVVE